MAETRRRDKEGKFIETSPFGKKIISVRLLKSDQEKFLDQSKNRGLSPTELARVAISEWLESQSLQE